MRNVLFVPVPLQYLYNAGVVVVVLGLYVAWFGLVGLGLVMSGYVRSGYNSLSTVLF